jgi:hypothetical protein
MLLGAPMGIANEEESNPERSKRKGHKVCRVFMDLANIDRKRHFGAWSHDHRVIFIGCPNPSRLSW